MANNNNTIWWLLAGAAVVLIAGSKPPQVDTTPTPGDSTPPAPPATSFPGYPIVYKQYNADVKLIQKVLGLKQDGVIGPVTLKALQKYIPNLTTRFSIEYGGVDEILNKIARSIAMGIK
jgi:hypothetical protein